jgi:glycosyltransferase involved in cell wall biosynthesis
LILPDQPIPDREALGRPCAAYDRGVRVLFIAYYFPPLGGGGVQRSVNFVRNLPAHGYDPLVITGPGRTGERWGPTDEGGTGDMSADVPVVRVPGPVPVGVSAMRSRLGNLVCAPTPFDRWWSRGVLDAAGAARDVSVVYASMDPYSSAAPAAAIARRLGVPWVADLRDPWAVDEYAAYPTGFQWWLDRQVMRRRLASAAAVVLPTPGTLARVRQTFPELRDRTIEIRNGFDPNEFGGTVEARSDDLFHLVHAGNFYYHPHAPRRGVRRMLGGTDFGVDLRPRSPMFLLEALDRLLAEHPDIAARIRVHLAGVLTPVEEAMVEGARCRNLVEMHGFVSHEAAVRLMASADALFLPMHALPPGVRSTIFPGKAYEYLASGRPILAALPAGDVRDVLERAEWTVVCDPDDTDAIARGVLELVEHRDARRRRNANRVELLRPFDRARLTADLARVFDGLATEQRPRMRTG